MSGDRGIAIVLLEPVDDIVLVVRVRNARPGVHHDLARGVRHIATEGVSFLAVNIPGDVIRLPVKAIGVVALGSIEAQVIHELVTALAVLVVVELHLGGILTEHLDIDLVPRIVVGRTSVGEEGGNNAVILDRLHGGLVVAVAVELIGSVLSAGIHTLAALVLIDGQGQLAAVEGGVGLMPPAIEAGTVRPSIGCEEVTSALAEVGNHGRIGIHGCTEVLDIASRSLRGSLCRSLSRCLGRSLCRSFSRSLCGCLSRSFGRSFGRILIRYSRLLTADRQGIDQLYDILEDVQGVGAVELGGQVNVCISLCLIVQFIGTKQVLVELDDIHDVYVSVEVYIAIEIVAGRLDLGRGLGRSLRRCLGRLLTRSCLRSIGICDGKQVGEGRVPVNGDLIGGIALGIINVALSRCCIYAVSLGSVVFLVGVDTADEHTLHSLACNHGRTMVRMLRRNGTVAGYEAGAERVLTEQVVELCIGSVHVSCIAGELVSQCADDAGIGNGHIAAPLELGQSHAVGIAAGILYKGISLLDHSSLCSSVLSGGLVAAGQDRNVAVVTNGGPVKTGLGADGIHSLLVLGIAGGYPELCSSPVTLVTVGLVAVLAGGDVSRVLEVEIRVCFEVSPCFLRSSQTLLSVCGIRGLVSLSSQSHRCAEISGCSRGDRGYDELIGLLVWSHVAREVLTGDLVVNTAVVSLHLEHPIQLVLGRFEDLRIGICLVCIQQVADGLCSSNDISAVVTGIMPAAGNIDLLVGAVDGRHTGVAGCVAELAGVDRNAAALEVEHLDAVVIQCAVGICADHERIALAETITGNDVGTSVLHGGEIALPVVLTSGGIAHLCGELAGVNGLLGSSIHHGKLGLVGHATENSDLLGVGLIADLVGEDGSLSGIRKALVCAGIIDQLKLYVVKVNGVLRELAAVLLLKAAVEYELCHRVICVLHGKLVGDGLRCGGDIDAIPDISGVIAAVLLDHALNETVGGAGNIVRQNILCILVQRDQRVEHLHGVSLLTGSLDVECELAVLYGQCAVTAGLLVDVPGALAGIKRCADNRLSGKCRKCSCRNSGCHHSESCECGCDSFESSFFHGINSPLKEVDSFPGNPRLDGYQGGLALSALW